MNTKDLSAYPNFSGSIPKHYEQYLGPLFFEPYAIEISKRINPSEVRFVLEIGCGTGRVTRHLRKVIPATAKLVASDISGDMLAVAKEKLKKANIDWQIIDAQQLPFDDNSIDVVVCCFGYMFVPDKPKAFAEAHRVLRPGGMLIFSTWDKLEFNEASYNYRKIVEEVLQVNLPASYNLPFSMNDHAEIKQMLLEAGFSKISIESVGKVSIGKTALKTADALAGGGSIYNEIMLQDSSLVKEIMSRLEKKLAEKFGASPMKAPMKAVISQAWK